MGVSIFGLPRVDVGTVEIGTPWDGTRGCIVKDVERLEAGLPA
jgi:hypothetical protein